MADKKQDSPKRKGLKALKTAFFEKDDEGNSYIDAMKQGSMLAIPAGGSLAFVGLVLGGIAFSEVGEYDPAFLDEASRDQSLSLSYDKAGGLINHNSYQAVSSDGQDVVLVNDDAGQWRVYQSQRDSDGDTELVLIADKYHAYAALKSKISDVEKTIEAFENFEIGASLKAPRFVSYDGISLPYTHDDNSVRRSVNGSVFVFKKGETLMPAYTTMQAKWNTAAQDILDHGFTEKVVQDDIERPEVDGSFVASIAGVSLLLGLGASVVGGVLGAGAASAGLAARRRKIRRFRNGR